jgi:hypothetical protein
MSEVNETPVAPATPVVPSTAPAPAPAQPAAAKKPLNAIQVIEQQIITYFQQKEQAIANVHALDGAIQASQQMLAKLKSIEAEAKKLASEAVTAVETEAAKIVDAVKAEVSKVETAVEGEVAKTESKVVSITDAAKKV